MEAKVFEAFRSAGAAADKASAAAQALSRRDIVEARLHALSYSGSASPGTLSVTDGTTSSSIKFAGNLALHNFTVVGADPGGGTLIQWHA
jgi:hypothetical protein